MNVCHRRWTWSRYAPGTTSGVEVTGGSPAYHVLSTRQAQEALQTQVTLHPPRLHTKCQCHGATVMLSNASRCLQEAIRLWLRNQTQTWLGMDWPHLSLVSRISEDYFRASLGAWIPSITKRTDSWDQPASGSLKHPLGQRGTRAWMAPQGQVLAGQAPSHRVSEDQAGPGFTLP